MNLTLATVDIFTALTQIGNDVYRNLMKTLIIAAVISAIIAIFILIFTHDDRKVGTAKALLLRIVLGVGIACVLGAIVSYLLSVTSSYRFNTSTTAVIAASLYNLII
jgi:hypothetical protein